MNACSPTSSSLPLSRALAPDHSAARALRAGRWCLIAIGVAFVANVLTGIANAVSEHAAIANSTYVVRGVSLAVVYACVVMHLEGFRSIGDGPRQSRSLTPKGVGVASAVVLLMILAPFSGPDAARSMIAQRDGLGTWIAFELLHSASWVVLLLYAGSVYLDVARRVAKPGLDFLAATLRWAACAYALVVSVLLAVALLVPSELKAEWADVFVSIIADARLITIAMFVWVGYRISRSASIELRHRAPERTSTRPGAESPTP